MKGDSMEATANQTDIDAAGQQHAELNQALRSAVSGGAADVTLRNVFGQRYIGTNLYGAADAQALKGLRIRIIGTPGNDMGAFLDGPSITVQGNVMDGTGNTMNHGRIVVHGRAGDITGFSARGGEIFIRDNAGYRAGIHMKEYMGKRPIMVIGGTTQDFLGEYMAGGVIIVLGLTLDGSNTHYCNHVGTGMHGGAIFIRGSVPDDQLAEAVGASEITAEDQTLLADYVEQYATLFGVDVSGIDLGSFTKLTPRSARPYKQLYAY